MKYLNALLITAALASTLGTSAFADNGIGDSHEWGGLIRNTR
jgi:hypothetical protein